MKTTFEGIEHLREAAELLAVKDEKLRERLTAAGEEFWRATYHYDRWPPDFQRFADTIIQRILSGGPVAETVPKMEMKDARGTASDILRFMIEAEKAAAAEHNGGNGNSH